jgi:hypothetical protein
VMLCGMNVPDSAVLELALQLRHSGFESVAERLEEAYDLETEVLGLTIPERETILQALADGDRDNPHLAELRAVLLVEHQGRTREGL